LAERLGEQSALFSQHPKECCLCHKPFERTKETVKTWMVTIINKNQTVRLTCPDCWAIIAESVEETNNET
jgi:nitrate/TMAO reductase-like tetraheme cytochrome c subunit